jgi:hypothetical protein
MNQTLVSRLMSSRKLLKSVSGESRSRAGLDLMINGLQRCMRALSVEAKLQTH